MLPLVSDGLFLARLQPLEVCSGHWLASLKLPPPRALNPPLPCDPTNAACSAALNDNGTGSFRASLKLHPRRPPTMDACTAALNGSALAGCLSRPGVPGAAIGAARGESGCRTRGCASFVGSVGPTREVPQPISGRFPVDSVELLIE